MVGAFTTAATINSGYARPKEPVSALEFMPNHQAHTPPAPELTPEQMQADSDFELAVLNLKHQLLREKAERENTHG